MQWLHSMWKNDIKANNKCVIRYNGALAGIEA